MYSHNASMLPLSAAATLMAGQAFKGSLKNDPVGDYFVLGSEGVKKGQVERSGLIQISSTQMEPFKFLKYGDVLLAAKTSAHRAYVYDLDLGNVVASSFFQIMRIDQEDMISPDFLAWYLNHPNVQQQLARLETGTTVKHLGKKALAQILIPIPPFEVQANIVSAASVVDEKVNILNTLIVETNRYWSALLWSQVIRGQE